jgi:hypothetical protein
VEKY